MAGALRLPWIKTSVENELTDALEIFKSYVSGQPELKKDNKCCRPGQVEIHLSRPQQAQVTDFPGGMRNPYDAVLSDGTHEIPAIFDKDAAQSFTENTQRGYHDIKGGIIVINKGYLVVNAALAPTRLSLRVLDFRLHGSEGSSLKGRPVDILTYPDVIRLVTKLEDLCAPPQESTQPQLSSSTSQDKSSQLSSGFATQFNHEKERPVSSPIVAQNPTVSKEDPLIAHLLGAGNPPQAVVSKPADNLAQKTVLGSVTDAKAHAMKSKVDNRMNIRSSHSSTSLSSDVQNGNTSKSVDDDLITHSHLHLHPSLEDNDKENSHENLRIQNGSPVQPRTEDRVQLQSLPLFVDQFQQNDAFEGLRRVSRQFVRISKDQKTMLERSDCWYEPQAGDRSRYANIPAKVMDDLTGFMQRKPTETPVEVEKLGHGPSESEDDIDDKSDEESQYGTSDEQPAGGLNRQNLDASLERRHRNSMERISNDKSPPPGNQTARDRFPPSGPQILNQAIDDGNSTDDDDQVPGAATPEPDDTAHQLLSGNETSSQPRLMEQLPSTLPVTIRKPQRRPHARIPVHIPSSSPTREEEIELAVPHAVGDIVEPGDEQVHTTVKASQELPSTAPPSSTYIQVKRTPYVKSRSFEEISLRQTGTGSRTAGDNISSDPIIPATFNDTSSSGKHISSLMDQVPAGIDRISGTQTLPTKDAPVHTQSNAAQDPDVAGNSVLRSRDEPTERVPVHKNIAVGNLGSEKSRVLPARHQRLSGHSSNSRAGEKRGIPSSSVSHQPKLQNAAYSRGQSGIGGVTSNDTSHIQKGKAPEAPSRQTHLTDRERQMFFSNVKIDDAALEGKELAELLLEEKRKARDAKRNFKAKEQLTRQLSESMIERPLRNPELEDFENGNLSVMSTFESKLQAVGLTQVEDGHRDSAPLEAIEQETLKPVDTEVDQLDDHSPLQEDLRSESLKAAQHSVEVTNDEVSVPEATVGTENLMTDSPMNGSDKQSLRSATPISKPSPMDVLTDESSPGLELIQATNLAPLEHSDIEPQRQSPPRQVLRSTKIAPRGDRQQNVSRIEDASISNDLTHENFLHTYPEYAGDKKCFTRALVCVEWLRLRRIPPWSMCDDFIRVYVEFEPFVRTLAKEGKLTLGAWEFYDEHVKTPLFERRFIDNEEKLATALSLLNPLYVQTLRRGYNTPAGDRSQSKVLKRSDSKSAVPQVRQNSVPKSLQAAQTSMEGRAASPELDYANIPSRRHARAPFFETASQLHNMQRTEECESSTRSVPDVERSDKKKRTLPWQQHRISLSPQSNGGNRMPEQEIRNVEGSDKKRRRLPWQQDHITSSPLSRGSHSMSRPASPSARSSESRKRRHPDDQRPATIAPPLRNSLAKSTTASRKENSSRPASRDSEIFKARHSTVHAARLSPELPDFTEKWVAKQQLTEDPIMEESKISGATSLPQKQLIKESLDGQRKSGISSNVNSPSSTKKRPYRDPAEVARAYAQRRRSGGLSSRASTPQSTPAKRFCTKPKTQASVKGLEPETQAWEY